MSLGQALATWTHLVRNSPFQRSEFGLHLDLNMAQTYKSSSLKSQVPLQDVEVRVEVVKHGNDAPPDVKGSAYAQKVLLSKKIKIHSYPFTYCCSKVPITGYGTQLIHL